MVSSPPLTLLRNAEVFAPEPRGRCQVLVGGGAILAIEPAFSDLPPGLCQVFDLGGARLIPGLIDPHVHLTGGGGESGPSSRVPGVLFGELSRAGVTSVVGVLGTDGTTRAVAGLVASTLALRDEGLSAWCWTGSYEVPPITLTGSVRSDIVFVDPIIGLGEVAISDHRSSQPTFDEVARLAADCHVGGMMSGKAGVLHLHLGDGPRGLELVRRLLDETELPPRVLYPTHVNRKRRLFAEALELARRGCTIDVTAFPVAEGEDALTAADAIVEYLRSDAPRDRLTVSSDGGGCLPTFDAGGRLLAMEVGSPGALAATLAELLTRGHALEAVLPVFTANVAAILRLQKKGRIAVGADADLVVLDDSHRIREVMARGRLLVRSGEAVSLGTFER
ncbi:MAG: beta-aspartyl-peptidase [Polyangiaceae bacterium]|nr:beta-aspartyl-peptidase [Polyangiaceae bacterium]